LFGRNPGLLGKRRTAEVPAERMVGSEHPVLALQRTAGNLAVPSLLRRCGNRRDAPPPALSEGVSIQRLHAQLQALSAIEEEQGECNCSPSRAGAIQRSVRFLDGDVIRKKNPAEATAKGDFSLGFTPPKLNGNLLQEKDAEARKAIQGPTLATEPATGLTGKFWGGFIAHVSTVPSNSVGYEMYLPTSPPWTASADPSFLGNLLPSYFGKCRGSEEEDEEESGQGEVTKGEAKPSRIKFSVSGPKGEGYLEKQVELHESVHVGLHKEVSDKYLVPWDQKLAQFQKNTVWGETPEIAMVKLFAKAGGTPEQIASQLNQSWNKASDDFHNSDAGKTNPVAGSVNKECTEAWLHYSVP
jgi:hypothetical protein